MSPSRPLREELVERIAVELHDQEGDIIEENYAVAAEFVLDAFLDALETRADEWCEGSYDTKMLDRGIPLELIAVLREGDEQ